MGIGQRLRESEEERISRRLKMAKKKCLYVEVYSSKKGSKRKSRYELAPGLCGFIYEENIDKRRRLRCSMRKKKCLL